MKIYIIIILLVFVIVVINKIYVNEPFGNLRVANELDPKRAIKQAVRKLCEKGGYTWVQGESEFIYDCKHNKTSCLKDSVYPTRENYVPRYYEWREYDSEDAKEAAKLGASFGSARLLSSSLGQSADLSKEEYIRSEETNGVCIIGNESFRQTCEKDSLNYDPSTGKCTVTKKYCNDRLLAYCDGDCFEPPVGMVLSKVAGTTLGRSVGLFFGDSIVMAACPEKFKNT